MMRQRLPAIHNPQSAIRNRTGFTLIELMIGIFIIIILAAIAIPLAGTLNKNEAVNGTAREVRSFLEGARDRARHAKLPRGVRFQVDQNDPTIITSMVYVGPAGNLSVGSITVVEDMTTTPPQKRILSLSPDARQLWLRLQSKGLLPPGSVLKLRDISGPSGTLATYTVFYDGMNWRLTKDFQGNANTTLYGNLDDYRLELGNSVLPNQEPRILEAPIDLKNCKLPSSWISTGRFDILFSPRGNVIGPAATAGHIHLLVTSLADKDANRAPGDPTKQDPEVVITITTQTGSVSSHSVFSPADPWKNAETGVETE